MPRGPVGMQVWVPECQDASLRLGGTGGAMEGGGHRGQRSGCVWGPGGSVSLFPSPLEARCAHPSDLPGSSMQDAMQDART